MNSNLYKPKKTNSLFFLPFMFTDLIQRTIFLEDDYYESTKLRYVFTEYNRGYITSLVKKENGVILDVGANIGNHTLYYANEIGAHVISFEPVYNTFSILKKQIEIN